MPAEGWYTRRLMEFPELDYVYIYQPTWSDLWVALFYVGLIVVLGCLVVYLFRD